VVVLAVCGSWLKGRSNAPAPQPEVAARPPAQADTKTKEQPPLETPRTEAAPAKKPKKEQTEKPAAPARASVSISSEPQGAEVSVDGRKEGTTPLDMADLKPGQTHRVKVAKAGYEAWSGSFSANPGETASVHAALREASAAMTINSTPGGAAISLDGQDTGRKTPASIDGVKPGRTYRVRLTLDGFAPFEQSVTPEAGRAGAVNASLVQLYGALTVNSQPWAVVVIDGDEKGTTPIAGIKLSAGEHSLALGNPKLKLGKRMKVRIEPNKTTRIVVDLSKAGE
jgi:hypothetical protein